VFHFYGNSKSATERAFQLNQNN